MRHSARPSLGIVVLGLCACNAGAADWPNWRGPNHDGISAEKGFQTKWDQPPPTVWTADLGPAFSGFSCVDGKAYTCGTRDHKQMLFCLDAGSGAIIWKTEIEGEYEERQGGDGTRATPTVHDGRVYVLGALGRLICCDARTGTVQWSQVFSKRPQWGYSGSVLIEGELAIATAGGDQGGLVAFNRKTGERVWACAEGTAGYATPYPFTHAGKRYIVAFLADAAIIAEAVGGRLACTIPWKTDWDVNAAAPIYHDGLLFLSSGYRTGSAVFRLTPEGEGLHATKVWPADAPASKVILGKFQSAVLYEGHLYVSEERALKCVEFATGKEKWAERGVSNGTVVLADGQLVVLGEDGELQIAPVSTEKFEPTTKVELLRGRSWTIPTLYGGRLYARNLKQAACFQLAAH